MKMKLNEMQATLYHMTSSSSLVCVRWKKENVLGGAESFAFPSI